MTGVPPPVAEGDKAGARNRAVIAAFASGIGAKVVTIVTSLVAIGLAASSLGDVRFGVVAAVTGAIGLFGFLDFGIGNALIGSVARLHAGTRKPEIARLIGDALAFLLVVGVGLAAIVTVAAVALPGSSLPGSGEVQQDAIRRALLVFGVCVGAAVPASLGSKVALGLQRGTQNSVVSAVAAGLTLGAVLLSTAVDGDVALFTGALMVAPVVCNGAQTWVLVREFRPRPSEVTLRGAFALLPAGVPFTILTLAGSFSYQLDILVVTYAVGLAAAGSFGLANRMFSSLTVLFSTGLQQLWASVAHALADGDTAWVRRTFWRTFALTMGAYGIGAVVLWWLGGWIVRIWTGGEVSVTPALLTACAVWSAYGFAMSQFSTLLNGAGVVWSQGFLALGMTALNVPLSIYLAHRWGVTGPLYASLIAHALIAGGPTVHLALQVLDGRERVSLLPRRRTRQG